MESDGIYLFNRCRRCNSLITKLEVLHTFKTGKELCACGSMMFGPTNPIGMEWLKPSVAKMAVYQILGRLAPPPSDGIVPPIPQTVKADRKVSPLYKQEQELLRGGE